MPLLFVLLLFIPPLVSCPAYGETLHALVVCDTNSNLKKTVLHDLGNIKTALKILSQKTSLTLRPHYLTGKNVTAKKINTITLSMTKRKGICLFYFSGHGFRTPTSLSPWPHLALFLKHEALSGEAIYQRLKKGAAYLTILVFDCCNQSLLPKTLTQPILLKHPSARRDPSLTLLKTLFLETQGCIVMAAAVPGEPEQGTTKGSFFTSSLLDSLAAGQDTTSWNEIISATGAKCSLSHQHPFCTLNITSK